MIFALLLGAFIVLQAMWKGKQAEKLQHAAGAWSMGKYRKILVAVDSSDSSRNALHQAFKLANEEKCWITVTSVVASL